MTPEESLERGLAEIMTPESLKRAQEALLHHLATEADGSADPNRTVRMELEFYRKDGSTVWLEEQVSGIRDDSGKLAGFHGVARDITERLKAEQALKDSERRYRLMADNSSDVIWTMDMDLRMTYVSPSIEKLTGYQRRGVDT